LSSNEFLSRKETACPEKPFWQASQGVATSEPALKISSQTFQREEGEP
jgi:hypothetical protein